MVPEVALRPGRNTVELYEVTAKGTQAPAHRQGLASVPRNGRMTFQERHDALLGRLYRSSRPNSSWFDEPLGSLRTDYRVLARVDQDADACAAVVARDAEAEVARLDPVGVGRLDVAAQLRDRPSASRTASAGGRPPRSRWSRTRSPAGCPGRRSRTRRTPRPAARRPPGPGAPRARPAACGTPGVASSRRLTSRRARNGATAPSSTRLPNSAMNTPSNTFRSRKASGGSRHSTTASSSVNSTNAGHWMPPRRRHSSRLRQKRSSGGIGRRVASDGACPAPPPTSSGSPGWGRCRTPKRSPSSTACGRRARPASCPTCCCCSSTRPCTRSAAAATTRTCRWASPGTSARASTSSAATAAGG